MPRHNLGPLSRNNLFVSMLPRTHLLAVAIVAVITLCLLSVVPSDVAVAKRTHTIESADSPQIESDTTGISALTTGEQVSADNLPPIAPQGESGKPTSTADEKEPAAQKVEEATMAARDSQPAQVAVPTSTRQTEQNSNETGWRSTRLKNGDNLTTAFSRLGLNAGDVHAVAHAKGETQNLRRLRPKEVISVQLDDQGQLATVKHVKSRLEHYLYQKIGEGAFKGEKIVREPEIRTAFNQGIIRNSLFLDASRAGLDQSKIMDLANIFGWDIDFALDIRKGDQFSVLYEERFLDDEKIGYGNILAASFTNQGTTHKAVLYREADGTTTYYSPDGRAMRKAFLRAPLDFTRVSSNFNPRRLHPVFKTVRPHNGVDYAAPRGTPVYAAGSGKVIASGYSRANGNYVVIRHGQKFVTKYLHLNKRKVRSGQSIKQRQIIGTVGSTGYATGPHLHYEFLVNGVHRNPRTVKLPEAKPIPADRMAAFTSRTGPLLARLEQLDRSRLALNTRAQ